MDNVVTIPKAFFYLVRRGVGAEDVEFEDGWGVYHASVALAEAACSCCQWLLAHRQRIHPVTRRSSFSISSFLGIPTDGREERKENETERLTMEMHQTPRTAHPFYSLNHFLGRCTDLGSTHLGLTSSQSLLRHCACEYRSVAIQDVNPATWAAPRVLCAARYADGTVLQPVAAEHWCTVYSDSAADEKGGRGSACLAHPYDHDQTYHQDVHPDFG